VAGELDLGRLADLPAALGLDLGQIVQTLIQELDRAVDDAGAALDADDLDGAAAAAHAGRSGDRRLARPRRRRARGARGGAGELAGAPRPARARIPSVAHEFPQTGGVCGKLRSDCR
jgi:predicted RecB family endonuclease